MKSLYESILDVEDNIDNMDKSIKDQIKQFLNNNFKNASRFKISEKPNKDGLYEVSGDDRVNIINKNITSLTNGMFIWTTVKESFICVNCNSLTSLNGAPKEVGRTFCCVDCGSKFTQEDVKKVSNVKGRIKV